MIAQKTALLESGRTREILRGISDMQQCHDMCTFDKLKTGNVIFVKLSCGPLVPVKVLNSEEGLCAPFGERSRADNRPSHWCDDSSRHFALRGRYVCAWLWLRVVDQGQKTV